MINSFTLLNPEQPVQNPEQPVQNPEQPVQNPEQPVQNPEQPVQGPAPESFFASARRRLGAFFTFGSQAQRAKNFIMSFVPSWASIKEQLPEISMQTLKDQLPTVDSIKARMPSVQSIKDAFSNISMQSMKDKFAAIRFPTRQDITAKFNAVLRAPSQHPVTIGLVVGTMALFTGLSFMGMLACSVGAYAVTTMRNRAYSAPLRNNIEDTNTPAAFNAGREDAASWTSYFNSYRTPNNWKNFIAYGKGLKQGMDELPANEPVQAEQQAQTNRLG